MNKNTLPSKNKRIFAKASPNTQCSFCGKEIIDNDGNTLDACNAQSCSCNEVFCYPDCFKEHQRSTGDKT